jgi:RimJ/RimL family protein N-acetyltransferase
VIIGKRIRLRAIEREDLPRFVAWLNDPEVRHNMLLYQPLSLAQEEVWFKGILERHPDEQPLVIEISADGVWQAVGNVSFFNLNTHDSSAEIGIFIGEKKYWDQGYGTESMRLMLKHGFEDLNLNRIYLRVFETNPRGMRAYDKAGFVHEGRMRQDRFLDGKYIDVHLMSVVRSEWQEEKNSGGKE